MVSGRPLFSVSKAVKVERVCCQIDRTHHAGVTLARYSNPKKGGDLLRRRA
jgi:hypothetical protein